VNGHGIKWVGAGGIITVALGVIGLYNFGNGYIEDKLAMERDKMAIEQRIMRLEMQVCDLNPETHWWRGDCVEDE